MSSTLTRGLIFKYPLDPTGINPTNKILSEEHDLGTGVNRAIVPDYSAFYSESMEVYVEDRVDPLVPHHQYILAQLHADASAALDKEVCMVVVVTDQAIMGKVRLTYQTVGGDFSVSVDALRKAIEDEDLDDRTVSWGDLIARPDAFPPAPHLHDIGDLYGFEYVVEALEALRNAILIGDEAMHEELRQFIRYEDGLLRDSITALDGRFQAHVQDHENPHATTKGQVGLGLVDNYATATQPEAEAGTLNNRFMTPLRTAQAIAAQALVPLNAHINDKGNPHQTTKQQVGLGNLPNAITDSRAENNPDTVLSGKGMYDHTKSGDHDDRYVRVNATSNGSIKIEAGIAYVYVTNAWQQFWPPLWQ